MKENKIICSICGQKLDKNEAINIDNKTVCVNCIYGNEKPFKIYPIGYVKNNLSRAKKGFGTVGEKGISVIELLNFQKKFMYRLEEEKYITVIYYLHETEEVYSVFKRGLDGKEVGIFASRTPHRLSKIGIQDVEIIKIEDISIYVEGLDAVNNSPVLDIKMKWSAY